MKKLKKTPYTRTPQAGALQVRDALWGERPDGRRRTQFAKKETWDRYHVAEA